MKLATSGVDEDPLVADVERAHFYLLRDFWIVIEGLQVSDVDPKQLDRQVIDSAVRSAMLRAFDDVDYQVSSWEVDELRKLTASALTEEDFCATFDRGEYFPDANFQLDLTRTVTNWNRTGSQYFLRRPRQLQNPLRQQLRALRSTFIQSGADNLVLADDGLSTGQMMRMVIDECLRSRLSVDRVVVCCNNIPNLREIHGVRVDSIVAPRDDVPWLNERDLYWGLPRAGLSFAPKGSTRTYGVPFTAKLDLVTQRIGIEDRAREFRAACLNVNIALWEYFERIANRPLRCEDCPPLSFVPEILHMRDRRIVDLLQELAGGRELEVESS